MAYSVKFLEKATNDANDYGTGAFFNQFESESAGYTSTNCSIVLSNHVWTMTGNAATTSMNWKYVTTNAYALNKIVFFRARVTITKVGATMTAITLTCNGSTSGSVSVKSQSNPAVGTTYDLYGRATLTGLVGNLVWIITVTDDVTTNTVTATIQDWVAFDLTTQQGAGWESSEADWYTWLVFRMRGWTWTDWYDMAWFKGGVGDGSDPFFRYCRATAHGLATYDMVGQTGDLAFGQVTRIDANWFAVGTGYPMFLGSATFTPYKATDRTSKIAKGTLKCNLRSDMEAYVTFDCYGDSTWRPRLGHTVQLWDGTTLLYVGKIESIDTTPLAPNARWLCSVTMKSLTSLINRILLDTSDSGSLDFQSSKAAVFQCFWFNSYLHGMGITWGIVDDGQTDIGEFGDNMYGMTDVMNSLAKQAGKVWYIDSERRLNFRDPLMAVSAAAHALVDGNGYLESRPGSYSNVKYLEQTSGYVSDILICGGVGDDGYRVFTIADNRTSGFTPISSDEEANMPYYQGIISDDLYNDSVTADAAAAKYLAAQGYAVPSTLTFSSTDTDWRPNTKLSVQLANVGISSLTYFNIDSVEMTDIDGLNMITNITATQRNSSSFVSAPAQGSTQYLSDVQQKAQDSVAAVHQQAGVFSPTLRGGTTAGTWAYTLQYGAFLRYQNLVWITISLNASSIGGGAAGDLIIGDLPFPSVAQRASFSVVTQQVAWPASSTNAGAQIVGAGTDIILYGFYNNGSLSRMQVSGLTAGDIIYVTGCYQCTPN
jgi:hypothetical protein